MLGPSAIEYVDQLERNLKPHPHAEAILVATQEEIDLNLARPLETRADVDSLRMGQLEALASSPGLPR